MDFVKEFEKRNAEQQKQVDAASTQQGTEYAQSAPRLPNPEQERSRYKGAGETSTRRITSYNVCYTKLLRGCET